MMMTRARRRRLFAAESSSVRLGSETPLAVPDEEERRDWANLMPDLMGEISGRLLSIDAAEYLRFRAACKPWRAHTDDPRACALDRRFRPRNWIVLAITPDPTPRRRLLNVATGASLAGVELPPLRTHCYLGAADGLLVLYHPLTRAIRLLDPLSNAVTEFPAISRSSIVVAAPPRNPRNVCAVHRDGCLITSHVIDGAGLDDSTSPPTLVLCLRDNVSNMVVAKPGDAHWTVVSAGDARHWLFDMLGRVAFLSLLSFEGRCYVSSPEGSVYLLQLQPLPRLVEVVNQRQRSLDDAIRYRYVTSFLIADGEGGRVLMVRYWRYLGLLAGVVPYDPAEAFSTVPGITSRMELLEVDVAGKRLLPLRSLGHRAAFMGETHCVLVSAETFPSLAPDAVYLGYCQQYTGHFSVYHVDSRKTEPAHELDRDRMILVPRARPCNLDQYLACYVDRRGPFGGVCIIHAEHSHLFLYPPQGLRPSD